MSTTIHYPKREKLIQMLKDEEEIRMGEEYIRMCDAAKDEVNGWLRISEEVQYAVAKKHGYVKGVELDFAVNRMRTAQYIYPNEPLFKTIPVYVRNNVAREGDYKKGDIVPHIMIHDENKTQITLHSLFSKDKVNLLMASSHT
jgi:hypothetical protein